MLDQMHIRNVALISEADFMPGEGLTVITGETGAGKTALVGALKMLVGERGDASLVREGADELAVEGRFFFEGGAEDGVVVARRVSAQGRSRVAVNGTLSSVGELAETIGSSVDLCGQHEHQHLMKPTGQRVLFDAWGASLIQAAHGRYREALAAVSAAAAEVERLEQLAAADAVALDRARFVVSQVEEVSPDAGEYEALLAEMPRFEHAELLLSESTAARNAVVGEGGALDAAGSALTSLERMAGVDATLQGAAQQVRDAFFALEDAASQLASYKDSIEFSPAEFQQRQERISAFQGLLRGFGPTMEQVFETYEQAKRSINEFDSRDELLQGAQDALAAAEAELQQAATELAEARGVCLPRFNSAVSEQLTRLHMAGAEVAGVLEDLPREQWSEWGPHTFELFFRPAPDMKLQPLNRIASGGEVSRVMLAIKVVLGEVDVASTLVFDEIDAGVGGETALSLGAVLADLARTHQVIVVTHLPQVAVLGATHYLVSKTEEGLPETKLELLENEARVREIARMLAGNVNETSLAHARELLAAQG